MVAIWCPGRESYATTDTMNPCLSLVWWRECLARWRRFATSRNPLSREPCFVISGQPSAGKHLRTLARFKSWRRNTRSLRNCPPNAKADPSGSPAPISQESVVAGGRNTRFFLSAGGKHCSAVGRLDGCPPKAFKDLRDQCRSLHTRKKSA